jgi:ketosteroid isomerase-like protein
MKSVLRAVGLVLVLLPKVVPLAGLTPATSEKDKIIDSERAWAQASVKGDAASMAGFMSEDYIEISADPVPGSTQTRWGTTSKAAWIDQIRSGHEKYTSVDLRNFNVYVHGDVATVTAEYSQTGTKDGKDISATGFYVNTWVKKKGGWRLVSSVFP